MAWSWSSRLPGAPAAPAAARAFVETSLQGLFRHPETIVETSEDLAVIVSELVTNAVQAASDFVRIDLDVGSEELRVAVTDEASGMPTLTGPAAFDQPYGRGLAIVAALSRDWGVTPLPGAVAGKTVWARLDLSARPDV